MTFPGLLFKPVKSSSVGKQWNTLRDTIIFNSEMLYCLFVYKGHLRLMSSLTYDSFKVKIY